VVVIVDADTSIDMGASAAAGVVVSIGEIVGIIASAVVDCGRTWTRPQASS
jgi:hypothetical protein